MQNGNVWKIAVCLGVLGLLIGGVARASDHPEYTVRILDPVEIAAREASAETPSVRSDEDLRHVTRALDNSSSRLLLPYYRVDRTRSDGETTLLAIRNPSPSLVRVEVEFFGLASNLLAERAYDLDPREIRTLNLRDLPALQGGAGGIARGYVIVSQLPRRGSPSVGVSGDYFRIDPGENFATGDRMIDMTETYLCDAWDFRYLEGGGFSGGTTLELLVAEAPGTGDSAPVAATISLYDEAGDLQAMAELKTSARVFEVDVTEILFPRRGRNQTGFGAAVIVFSEASGGGLVAGRYSADGRYSISIPGSCVEGDGGGRFGLP